MQYEAHSYSFIICLDEVTNIMTHHVLIRVRECNSNKAI